MARSNGCGAVWRVGVTAAAGDEVGKFAIATIRINANANPMIVCVCNAIREKDLREACVAAAKNRPMSMPGWAANPNAANACPSPRM
jgi:hypothetical protein